MKPGWLLAALVVCGCGGQASRTEPSPTPASSPIVYFAKVGIGDFDTFNSAPFTTRGNWQLSWAYDCSNLTPAAGELPHDWLILAVYRETIAPHAVLFDEITPSPKMAASGVATETHTDAAAGPPKGRFFIKVMTECSWDLKAEPLN